MRKITNLIIKVLIIWGAAQLFPAYVICSNIKALIFAIICLVLIETVWGVVLAASAILSLNKLPVQFVFVSTLIIAMALNIIQLWLTTKIVPGFEINGFATIIILSAILGLFGTGSSKHNN